MKKLLFFLMAILFAIQGLQAQTGNTGGMNTPPVNPATLPYSCNFEDPTENAEWVLSNSTCTNKWYIGTPSNVQAPLSGGRLFISNDSGISNAYTIANAGVVTATRYIQSTGANNYVLNFDLLIGGESIHDYIKVFVVDVDTTYNGLSGSTYPYFAVAAFATNQYMFGNAGVPYFNGYNGTAVVSGYYPRSVVLPSLGPSGTVKKLIILWKNDTSAGTMPPASIDNLTITPSNCATPTALSVSNITINSVDLSWTENGTATQWNVYYRMNTESTWTTIQATSNPYTLTGLNSSTNYQIRVQSDCIADQSAFSNLLSLQTSCLPYSQFPFFEGFESGFEPTALAPGNAVAPLCWLNINGQTTAGLWKSTTTAAYVRTGTAAAQQSTGSATGLQNDYLISPIVTLTGNERLRFYAKGYSSYIDNIRVGIYDIAQNGHDISAITDSSLFATILPNTIIEWTNWTEIIIPLNNYVGDFRLAFIRDLIGGYYLNIDDVSIETIPSCPQPVSSSIVLGVNTATINWVPANQSQGSFYLYYKTSNVSNYDSVLVNSTSYTFQNLTSDSTYNYYIKADCGTELSAPTPVKKFKTLCSVITALPYSEFFDTYSTGTSAYPTCWYKLTTNPSYPSISTTNASGPGSLYFTMAYAYGYSIAISPKIDVSIPINTIKASLKLRAAALDDTLYVGVMTDPYDVTTFEQVGFLTVSAITTFQDKEFYFTNYTGAGQHIAFKGAFSGNSSAIYIDNLVLDAIPSCPNPTALNVSGVIDTEVNLGWLENGTATTWNIEYGPTGFTQGSGTMITGVASNPYTLSGLTAQTTYQFYVQADCGAGTLSTWSNPYSFTTACASITTLPWTDFFDTYPTTGYYFPTCWTKKSNVTDRPYINTGGFSPSGLLYFYTGSVGNYNYAITPMFNASIPVNSLTASFKYKTYYLTDTLYVGVMTDPSDLSTFTVVQTVGAPSTSTFYDREVHFTNYLGTGQYIAFKINYQGTSASYGYVDNLSVDLTPSCPKPTQLSASNIFPNSVDLNWLENGSATTWNIEYGAPGFAQGTGTTIIGVTSNPYSLSGLTTQTTYQFYIQADCGAGDTSVWSNPFTFTTACEDITTLPYNESFDTYTTGTTIFPTCWKKITSNTYPYIATTNYSAPGSMYMYTASGAYNYIATPAFDPSISINTLSAFFKLYKSTAAYNITVGVMTDPTNMTTFDSIANLTPAALTTWQTFGVDFSNYTGIGRYIAFKVQGFGATNSMYIDDLTIMTTPSCNIPTGLTRTASTFNSMELDWSAADDANCAGWIIEYKPYDDLVWQSEYTTTHPHTISNLVSNVVYRIRVKAVCTSGDTTYTSDIVNYGLPCEPISYFPWEEGFEGVWFVGNGFGSSTDSRPWCWYNVNGGASTSYKWQRTATAAYVRTGLGSLQMYAAATTAQLGDWMITPAFTFTGNERIKFWAKGYSTYTDILSVKIFDVTTNGIVDAEVDTSLFVTIMPNTTIPAAAWTEYEINLSQFVGNYQIAFVRNTTGGYYLNIDDIMIDAIPSCPDISQLSLLSSTATDVTLNWTFNTNAGVGFEISYANVNTGFDPSTGTIITVPNGTTLPYVVSNLTPGQFYSFAVRQACNGTWSNIVVTNTDGLPAVLPYSCNFSDINEQASWKISNGNATNKFYIGTPSNVNAPISGANLFITNDNGLTNAYTNTSISTAIVSRLIEFTGDAAYRLAFDLYIGGESSYDYIKVFLTDPDTNFVGANSKPYYAINTYNGNNQLLTNYNNAPYFNAYNGSSTTAGSYPREIILPSQGSAGTVKRLIILWANDGGGGTPPPASIDNIVIEALTCPIPNTIATSNLTSSSTDITWVDPSGTATDWVVKWKPASTSIWNMASSNATTYSLSSLSVNTAYNVSIATVCGSDTSLYTNFNFTTPCAAVTTIPYTENFDTYGTTAGTFPSCWFRPVLNTTTPFPSIVTAYLVSSPASLKFQSASAALPTYAITPQFDLDINTLRVTFKLKAESITSSGTMQVGIMSDPNNLSTFELVETIIPTSTSFTTYEVMFTNTTLSGMGKFIAFRHITSSSVYYYWLDDVVVDLAPTCVKPTQIVASNITTTTADISWTPGYATDNAWWVYFKTSVATTYDSVYVTSNPYILPGLTPATTYQLYMKTDCGTQLSDPSNTITFTTPCIPFTTLPFVEYFDTYSTGTSAYPTCWSKLTSNATYPYISTTNFSGPGSLYIYSGTAGGYCYAISPMFDATIPINTLKAEFKLRVSATDDTLYVGVMTDPTNMATFELIQKLIPSAITTWQDMEVLFNNYNGTGQYIAFKNVYTTTSTTIYVDNLEVFPIPTCPRPTALVVSNITSSSLDLDWTEPGVANQWQIQYGPSGFTLGTGTVINISTHPTNIPLLTPSTSYDFYVRSICGAGDTSIWSVKVVGITACVPITTLPWNEGFETLTAATQLPVCWNSTNLGTYTNSQIVDYTSYNRVAHTGTKAIYFRWGCDDRFFTPGFQLTAGVTYNFSYWYITDGLSGWSTLQLAAYSGQTAGTLIQTINTISTPVTTTYTQVNATFTPTTSDVFYFGIYCQSNSTPYYLTLDDFSLTGPAVTCPIPTNLAVNGVTSSTANATWTETGSATSWEIAYKPTSSSTWTTALVATVPTYNFTTLTPSTVYDVKVRAICSVGDTSAYTSVVNFTTTTPPCDVPTNLQVTNITDQSALATWNAGTAISWQVEYKLVSSANWTSATTSTPSFAMAGLQSNSSYEIRVKAICTSNESAFTANIPFTTLSGTVTYTITATASTFGTITPSGVVTVNAGANQLFTFTPDGGYYVDAVVVDGVPITNPQPTYEFMNVQANHTISVEFLPFGIEENELALLVELFPNPTTSIIELRLKAEDLHIKECKIFDMYGKLMRVIPIYAETTSIDVTDFASGVYFVRMDSERGTISKKFVKK